MLYLQFVKGRVVKRFYLQMDDSYLKYFCIEE